MKHIMHPEHFKTGTRVLLLKGRYKDGIVNERTISLVTSDIGHFNRTLRHLQEAAEPGERIYGTAGERDVPRAIRLFKERQLDANYDDDPTRFYERLNDRWVSCLMNPASQKKKLWLFDCDDEEQEIVVRGEISQFYIAGAFGKKMVPHIYSSKNGTHIVVSPFDRSNLSTVALKALHDNAIMLWAY